MSNPNYNSQSPGYANKGAGGYKYHKGVKAAKGTEKDTVKKWPNPQPEWKTSFNSKAKFPVVKTRVVSHGID